MANRAFDSLFSVFQARHREFRLRFRTALSGCLVSLNPRVTRKICSLIFIRKGFLRSRQLKWLFVWSLQLLFAAFHSAFTVSTSQCYSYIYTALRLLCIESYTQNVGQQSVLLHLYLAIAPLFRRPCVYWTSLQSFANFYWFGLLQTYRSNHVSIYDVSDRLCEDLAYTVVCEDLA